MDQDGGQTPDASSVSSELISPIGESINGVFLPRLPSSINTCCFQCMSLARSISVLFGKVSCLFANSLFSCFRTSLLLPLFICMQLGMNMNMSTMAAVSESLSILMYTERGSRAVAAT